MVIMLSILIITGFVAGSIGSLIGLGGGIITVPVLLYLSSVSGLIEITPQVAAGTSLLVIVVTALSSTLSYTKQKKIDIRSGLLFVIASGPGAVLGVYVNQYLNAEQFMIYFGLFLLLAAALLTIKLKPRQSGNLPHVTRTYTDPQTGEILTYGYHLLPAFSVSLCVGITSSLFGVGGGILMVPAMMLLFRFPPQVATATSIFIVLFSAAIGSITNIVYENINWLYVLALAPGAWLGGKTGAFLSKKIKGPHLKYICAAVLALVGIRMIVQG